MDATNWANIIIATISNITSVVLAIIAYRSSIDVIKTRELVKKKNPEQPDVNAKIPSLGFKSFITSLIWFFVLVLVGVTIFIIWNSNQYKFKSLWAFNQDAQAWLSEQPTTNKPEEAKTSVDWDSASQALRASFDFTDVPNPLPRDTEPRATFYVKPGNSDLSGFQTLQFDITNRSNHNLKVTVSISNSDCWYESGEFTPVSKNSEKATFKFNLRAYIFKTCKTSDQYAYPPVAFDQVWRLDIIISTDERPWRNVNGDVLIDNIQLTDPVTP